MKRYIILVILVSLFVPRFAAAQVNLVANGGFDTGVSGWTTNASSGYYDPLKGDPGGCFTLYGSISQNITGLVSGSLYSISGSYSVEGGSLGSTPSFGVSTDGGILYDVTPHDYSWHDFSFNYTAASSSAVLGLVAQLNGANDVYRVDNVSIQIVPEPEIMSLLALSGIGWLLRARRPNHRPVSERQ